MTTDSSDAYDESKFAELVLYVADRMAEDPSFGATKLNKILFYADFTHYAEHGRSITGAEYQKLPHGPAPRRLLPVQADLVTNGDAVLRRQFVGNYEQKRLVPLRPADVSGFSGTEIATVERVITQFDSRSALQVSWLSHKLLGWRAARERDTIPYVSVFLYDGPVTESDELWAKEVATDLGDRLVGAGVA